MPHPLLMRRSLPGSSLGLLHLAESWDLAEESGARVDAHAGLSLSDINTVTQGAGPGGNSFAAEFTAANNEYLTHADAGDVFDPGTSDFSFEFLAYVASYTAQRGLIGKGATADTNVTTATGYSVVVTTAGRVALRFGDGSTATRITLTSQAVLSTGAWYHAAINCDRDGLASLYLNGALDSSVSIAAQAGSMNGTAPFALGAVSTSGGSFVNPFDGRIARFRRRLRIPSPSEIAWLCNGTVGRTYSELRGYAG